MRSNMIRYGYLFAAICLAISISAASAQPGIDEVTSANWTATGILAHESAMRGGEWIDLPDFNLG